MPESNKGWPRASTNRHYLPHTQTTMIEVAAQYSVEFLVNHSKQYDTVWATNWIHAKEIICEKHNIPMSDIVGVILRKV